MGMFWPMVASAAISAGGNIAGGLLGRGGDGDEIDYDKINQMMRTPLPEYPEAEGARKDWWSKLQEWGGQPGYGAITPDWESIWNLAKNKLTQYYWGGTMDTGLAGKVQASAARRNVSQSPALENMLTAMGMQEAGDIRELAGTEAEKKATFAETGRQNWLTSLMNLTSVRPKFPGQVAYDTSPIPSYGVGNMISDVSGGIGGLFSQYAQQEYLTNQKQTEQDWLMKLFEQYSGGSGGSSLLSSYGAAKPINYGENIFSRGFNFPEPGSYQ